jgi:hypothetical protein
VSEDTYSRVAPKCPYCGYEQTHDGGSLYDEDLTELECGRCDRTFDVEVYHSTSWTCRPREVDNG